MVNSHHFRQLAVIAVLAAFATHSSGAFLQISFVESSGDLKQPLAVEERTLHATVESAPSATPEDIGDAMMVHQRYQAAIEAYEHASQQSPDVWNKMGIAWNQLGQLDKAMKDYQHSLKLRPQYAEAQNNIGTVYYASKSYRRAIGAYRKALRITSDSASFHMNLGTAYMARKMEKEATVEFQAALKIDPDAFENHGTGGTTLEERSVDEKARYHYTWAKIYASENRPELALQYLRKALEEGFKDRKKMEHDAEFDALRDTPEFKELMTLEPRVL